MQFSPLAGVYFPELRRRLLVNTSNPMFHLCFSSVNRSNSKAHSKATGIEKKAAGEPVRECRVAQLNSDQFAADHAPKRTPIRTREKDGKNEGLHRRAAAPRAVSRSIILLFKIYGSETPINETPPLRLF